MAAFGDAGHAFPAIALARALRRRGHEVLVETWERWREPVEAEGLRFTAAEEYKTFPPPRAGFGGWRLGGGRGAGAGAADRGVPAGRRGQRRAHGGAGAGGREGGRRRATLIPHVYPVHEPGMPFFAFGAQPPRTALGRAVWRAWLPVLTAACGAAGGR